jgi:ribonucleoside-diphosphate reductase alpha chain
VNLYSFVENPFTDKAYFNYDKFKDVVYKAQRLMDDIVDLEEEKINLILNKIENDPEPEEIKQVEKNLWIKIKSKLLDGRRTGLSAIGLADCFGAIGLSYGSDSTPIGEEFSSWNAPKSSIELAEEIYKQFAISAYKSSIDMARERGAFPIFDLDTEEQIRHPYLDRIINTSNLDDDTMIDYQMYGRRNISLLTIPPSGTISMMAGISSGIEPVYQLYYKRRYKILENTEEKKQYDFIDANGDKWREYIVFHPKFKEWYNIKYPGGVNSFESIPEGLLEEIIIESPYNNSTAYEIDPIQRVKLQGAIQKWIDHSISSTINLPEEVSEADVSNIYFTAWKEGLKGITIYRNNCRTGVLVDIKDKEFKQHDAPKRPKVLPCTVYKTKSRGKEWLVIVGLYEGKPYEVFTVENIYNIQYSEIVGEVIKVAKGKYDLSLKDETYIENITSDIPDTEDLLTRMISTALRHGSDIQFIVEQLGKSEGDITSFGKATARILKHYINDNKQSKDLCPECNSEMVYEAGCKTCKHCGYSKCG